MIAPQPDWNRVASALRGAKRVALACHEKPDGDAVGSLLALSLVLRRLGAETYPTWSAASVEAVAPYAWLPGKDHLVQVSDIPSDVPVFVAIDCGAAERLGELEEIARRAPCLINIDHHPGNDEFAHLNVVEPSASSTAELVASLAAALGVELDQDIATCLYVGIVTDTGRFQYTNSSPHTLRLAATLLEHGVPAPTIAQELFESAPFGLLKLVGRLLERATLYEEERFVYSWLQRADLDETGVTPQETDGLIDAIRSTRAADVAALFKQQLDGSYRVSLRSKSPSVGVIARARGGGGHELAAGFTADDVEGTAEEIRAHLAHRAVDLSRDPRADRWDSGDPPADRSEPSTGP
jgi:bifunctional oligoribonuclease and PAP phosphatase NrnA